MNSIDKAMLSTFPLVACLRNGVPPAADKSGTRYVVASNGLFREIDLPWVQLVHRIGNVNKHFRIPYGEMHESVTISCEAIPAEVIQQLHEAARGAMPNEMAAALIWNVQTGQWRCELRESLMASPGHVRYQEVKLAENEHLVVDMHSHGFHPAFFSATDDADDMGSMKFRMVLGCVHEAEPEMQIQLCMAGLLMSAHLSDDGMLSAEV